VLEVKSYVTLETTCEPSTFGRINDDMAAFPPSELSENAPY
jgi:hypothetical protein